jgi:hypothetical protein
MEQETKLITFIQKEVMLEKVQTQEDVEICMNQNRRAKTMVDWAESMRKEATAPILASKKKIDMIWAEREAPLLALITHNKQNLEAYMFEQEQQRAQQLKNETGFNKKESNSLAKIEVKQEAGVSYRNDWDLEIIDISIVPDKFIIKTLDEKAIKDHLRNGGTVVKGVKITPRKTIITK